MVAVTRRIGLSLGADICWPIAFTEILKQLDPALPLEGETVRFEVERMTIDPFDLRAPGRHDVVIDRLTHWYRPRREWIKKAVLLDDVYVYNNPWTVQSVEKLSAYAGLIRLGFPIPRTWLVPPRDYAPHPDLDHTLRTHARHFDLGAVGAELGYPLYMKPYDGGGWQGVSRIADEQALRTTYDDSGTMLMTLQESIEPYDHFVRCIGLGPQTRLVRYDPSAPHHDRYTPAHPDDYLTADDRAVIEGTTLIINAFFGWDFNSCEALRRAGTWHPIDFANPCPDSQVTSLHYHFPWLIKANLRWSIFAAATDRPMRRNLDWEPFYAVADRDLPYREKLAEYARIAHERFETERFRDFCRKHLGHLDELAYDFFGSEVLRDAIRQKVTALFPAHEIDEFTELFWSRVQLWREQEGARGDQDGF